VVRGQRCGARSRPLRCDASGQPAIETPIRGNGSRERQENLEGVVTYKRLPEEDLEHVLAHTRHLWEDLRGKQIFVTGGTGFFGRWLLESLAWINDRLGLGASAVVLTRDADGFRATAPHLADHPTIRLHPGDVRSFEFPAGRFSHVIHAAAQFGTGVNATDPLADLAIATDGTHRVMDLARRCDTRRVLLTSSGAVYGTQPPDLSHLSEDHSGAPDPLDPTTVYGQGKRMAEHVAGLYGSRYGIETTVARCFAFIGPYLPLHGHFAAGNFLRDGLAGGPIRVNADGTAIRSYLYAADMAVWLWTTLFCGEPSRAYNVGSEHGLSTGALAQAVAARLGVPVLIAKAPVAGQPAHRYVPCTQRARVELGLTQRICLDEAIERTVRWLRTTSFD
jgi:nucleoside-diphosphate-sugar epimerase